MSLESFFCAETSAATSINLKSVGNIAKEAIYACVIVVSITWVSCNWTPT